MHVVNNIAHYASETRHFCLIKLHTIFCLFDLLTRFVLCSCFVWLEWLCVYVWRIWSGILNQINKSKGNVLDGFCRKWWNEKMFFFYSKWYGLVWGEACMVTSASLSRMAFSNYHLSSLIALCYEHTNSYAIAIVIPQFSKTINTEVLWFQTEFFFPRKY